LQDVLDAKEDGFEIVFISIDETIGDWEIVSGEQTLPWLSVADLGGFERETPLAYGVRFTLKAYLLDSKRSKHIRKI
jgi:hypothetical protein